MDKKNKIPIARMIVFFIGLILLSLGIDLNTKTMLGISPINSVPYNVHMLSDIPLGVCVYINNVCLIILQWLLLRKSFQPIQLLQFVTSLINSAFVQLFDNHIPVVTEMLFALSFHIPYKISDWEQYFPWSLPDDL